MPNTLCRARFSSLLRFSLPSKSDTRGQLPLQNSIICYRRVPGLFVWGKFQVDAVIFQSLSVHIPVQCLRNEMVEE